MLKGHVDVCLADTAADAKIALRADPDVTGAIVDYVLPDARGVALARELLEIVPGLPILVVTGHVIPEPANEAYEAGLGFHYKPLDLGDVFEFLRRAAAHRERRVEAIVAFATRFGFTERERQVFEHALAGLIRKEIADHMKLSESSVKVLVRSMLGKTRLATLDEIVKRFLWPRPD